MRTRSTLCPIERRCPMNLANLLEQHIERLGETKYLVFQDRVLTNVDMKRLACKIGNAFRSLGVGRGDHVVVSMPNYPEVMAAFQGIWRVGAVIIPIMFMLGPEETRYILDDSDAKAVITSRELQEKVLEASQGIAHLEHVIVMGGEDSPRTLSLERLLGEAQEDLDIVDVEDDEVALMIYTSGTTGRPKGVMLTHGNLYSNAVGGWEANEFDRLGRGVSTLLCLPLAHSFGVVVMNAGFLNPYPGAFYVLMSWFNPEEIFQLIERHKVYAFTGVPTMYHILLNHPAAEKYDLSSLKRCIISAAPVTPELYKAFTEKFKVEMLEGYGLTEASPAVALCRGSMPYKPGSCGVPFPNVEVRIVDDEDRFLPPYEHGEIVVRGPNVMKGYYKRPEETAQALRNGWLHTGDVGYLDEEGYLYITDRKKDMIIKGGENIYPSEVESYLVEHPAVSEAAVIGIPDEKYGEDVMAFVVLNPGHEATEEELITFCQARVAKFKCPARIKFVAALPKTLVGKVQKGELRKMV